ncbi:hypothetical protein GCM10009573_20180 [Agromyces bracchium]
MLAVLVFPSVEGKFGSATAGAAATSGAATASAAAAAKVAVRDRWCVGVGPVDIEYSPVSATCR